MGKALICTVGTVFEGRENIVNVLVNEIRTFAPDFVAFVVSPESKSTAEKIAGRAELPGSAVEYVELGTPHDLNEVFERTNEAIRRLRVAGFAAADISINYTSGTKVMGSGAVLAAVFNQCNQLRYVYEGGAAKDRVITTRPEAVTAFRDLLLGARLIEEMRFQSATHVLGRIDSSLLSDYDVALLDALHRIAHAYYSWDNFHPAVFIDTVKDLSPAGDVLAKFLVDSTTVALLAELARDLEGGRFSPVVLADMVNNAVRRKLEGKLDDAVARLYRAMEMLAQWVLNGLDVDADDVDTRRVPPRQRVTFEAMRSPDDGKVRIGMRKAYELLALLGAPLGTKFEQNEELGEMLQTRSKSILAHGTQTLKEEDCEKLLRIVIDLFSSEIPDFVETCHSLQFPWLRDRAAGQKAGTA